MRDKKGKFIKGHEILTKGLKRTKIGTFRKRMTEKERLKKKCDQVKKWNQSEKGKIYKRKYEIANRERYMQMNRNNNYLRKYGITLAYKIELIKKQGGNCLICTKKIDETSGHVDHNHKTGEIRGILCGTCNAGLGMFQDDIQLLQNAIDYLKGVSM